MKNIHVLSTDKPSRLLYDKEESCYLPLQDKPVFMDYQHLVKNRHIYITSDEEIKKDDYRMNIQRSYFKKSDKKGLEYYNKRNDVFKKIILTTDQDLIADNVQAVTDEFLEWFIKNPSCEYVEIVKGFADGTNYGYNFLDYKIIIPKEEPKCSCEEHDPYCCKVHGICPTCVKKEEPKQECNHEIVEKFGVSECQNCGMEESEIISLKKKETLEQAARKYSENRETKFEENLSFIDFINGAKWQAERMYSEEDVYKILLNYQSNYPYANNETGLTKWFKQFKNK